MLPTIGDILSLASEHLFAKVEWAPRPGLLTGRVVIVTGASGGLGLETCIQLGKLDPSLVIMACRDVNKGEEARTKVLTETGLTEGRVQLWELDLASFASVKAFAARCEANLSRLDVVVQNAGVASWRWASTEDGWENALQVNVLSTGVLSLLLLPLLAKTAKLALEPDMRPFKPHLTILSSAAHIWSPYQRPSPDTALLANLNNPAAKSLPPGDPRYAFTKLASVFITRQIARLPAASEVVLNCVHPGLCVSEFRRELKGVVAWLIDSMAWSAAKGAKNICWAATEETPSGAYVSGGAVAQPSAFARSEAGLLLEHDLWQEMVAEWIKVAPGVKGVLA